MPDSLIEELPTDVSRLVSLVLHSAGKRPRPRRLRRCRQTGGPTAVGKSGVGKSGVSSSFLPEGEIRCQFIILARREIREGGKSGVSSSFLPEGKSGKGNPVSVLHSCPKGNPGREIRCQFSILARREIRCRFSILARKDEPTSDYAKR